MSLKGKKILIIGAGPLQTPAIRRARRMGLTVLATDMDPNAPGFALAHRRAIISTLDAPATVEFARREKIHGVMTLATDIPLVTVAAVADALNLCAPSPATAQHATHKYKMKKTFAAKGVPCPRFELASSPAQALEAARRIGYPVVTKPINGSGSRAVTLIKKPADLAPAFLAARQVARSRNVVIEEFARGRHLCVEAFTWNHETRVICVIDRMVSRPPHFVELRHTFPSTLSRKVLSQVEEVTAAGIRALGIPAGPSHTDIIVTDRGPVISEIGARLDGDYKSSHFMPLVFGYDIIGDTIRAALGETPLLFAGGGMDLIPRSALCIHYLQPEPGVVKSVTGKTAARKMPGVEYFDSPLKRGFEIVPFKRSHDRVGVVIASGSTRKQAVSNALAVDDVIRISYH